MNNDMNIQNVLYQLRHLLEFAIADPLSEASRGTATHTLYFSGTNIAGQINYLDRKAATGGSFLVYVSDVLKTVTTHYTYSNTTGEITWTGYTPPAGTDNIKVVYTAIKSWCFDDNPNLDTRSFPRISVLDSGTEHEDSGQGIYRDYANSPGQYLTRRIQVIVRDRKSERPPSFTYQGYHYQNYDLVQAIAQNIKYYFNTNALPPKWKFWRWKVIRDERVFTDEVTNGILRHDVIVNVSYYDVVA